MKPYLDWSAYKDDDMEVPVIANGLSQMRAHGDERARHLAQVLRTP